MLSKGNKLYPISEKYNDLLNTLSSVGEPIKPSEITQEIFFEMSLIRYYGWVYRKNMKRMVRHTTAELFQDLIAHKLKRAFVGYENVKLVLESKDQPIKIKSKNKTPRVDIAINYEGVPSVLIEVKTNIGWSRPKSDEWVAMSNRFDNLSKSFNVEREDIFLILETPMNVSTPFANYWWDKKNNKKWDDPNLPDYWIYQQVIPLYYSADPYYWEEFQNFRDKNELPSLKLVKDVMYNKRETSEIMNFDKIIKKVKEKTNYG